MEIFWILTFSLLLLPGLLGVFLPVPGLAYMMIVALVYGFVDKFVHLTPTNFVILGLIFIISVITDSLSGIIGAKYGGASRRSVLIGIAGLILGVIVLPPFGGLIGLFIGVLISELTLKVKRTQAIKAASASLVGSILGMIISLLLSILFIVLFVIFALK